MPTKSLWSSCGCRSSMARGTQKALTPTPTLIQRMAPCMTGTMRRRPGSLKYDLSLSFELLQFLSLYCADFTTNHINLKQLQPEACLNSSLGFCVTIKWVVSLDNGGLHRRLSSQLRLHSGRRSRCKQSCAERLRPSGSQTGQQTTRQGETSGSRSEPHHRAAAADDDRQRTQTERREKESRSR